MKRVFLCALCAVALDAQSLSITQPASGSAISGYAGDQFEVSLTSAPSVTRVCYTVDTYAAYNPGINAATTLGCSLTPPFSYPYNSYWNADGSHQVVATAYNSVNGVVATSAAVPFTTANTWPVACTNGSAPVWTVNPSTPITSNWAGIITLTATVTGSCSTDSKTFSIYADGIFQASIGTTAASQALSLYTTQFQNGTHYICERFDDSTNQSVISGDDITAAGDWCAAVNIQNGAVATAQAQLASDKIYLAPGGSSGGNCLTAANGSGSCTETAVIQNTDGSTTNGTPVFAIEANTGYFTLGGPLGPSGTVATVNRSTGVVTAVANGMASIAGMVPNFTGSTLATSNDYCYEVHTSSGPVFNPTMNGWLLNITSGTGYTPGVYVLTSINTSGDAYLENMSGALTCAAATGTTGGVFATGPTRTGQVFVWSSNTMPCIGSNGARYSNYNASCFVVHSMFSSNVLLTNDPPFTPGMPAYINSGGVNTFEIGAPYTSFTGSESSSGQAAWASAQNAYVAKWEGYISGYSRLGFWCTGDNLTDSSQSLYGSTTGPAAMWTIPGPELVWMSWSDVGNTRGCSMKDEVTGAWGTNPLQGPLTLGASSQSWLAHITASSGTCTVSTGSGTLPVSLNTAHEFLITGSAISGMNSVYPNAYAASNFLPSGSGPYTSFQFPCPSVANGTYGTGGTSDPGLQIQPYATDWQANTSTGFAPYSVFATLASQFAASGATFGMGWPPAGDSYAQPQWWGNATQVIGGVTQVANFNDVYAADGNSQYLVQRLGANTILNAALNIGWTMRTMYGAYNPQLPLIVLTTSVGVGQGTSGYGQTGYKAAVCSTSGNTITFCSPHGITNIIPGMTRISIAGATNSGSAVDSTNSVISSTKAQTTALYVLSAPTPTTVTVAMSVPDFTVAGTGGTLTYANGNTKALANFNAATSQVCNDGICGSQIYYSGASDPTQSRNYGYTFTVSGVSGTVTTNSTCLVPASCNLTRTFQMVAENLNPPSGNQPTQLTWREIPILSATGGTATIIADNNYVKGRNYSPEYTDTNADWVAGEEFECQIMRCAGTRIYKMNPAMSGYSPASGFSALSGTSLVETFADTTLGSQFFIDPYFENGQGVPIYHAHSIPGLAWERWNSLCAGETRRNSVDLGSFFDVASTADCLIVFNATDAPQTVTIPTSVQLKGGQQFIQQIVTGHSIGVETLNAAGTASVTVTIPAVSAVYLVFPANFAAEVLRPSITPEINAIANAASVVIVYSYDPYYLDAGGNTFSCGSAPVCQPNWDRSIGTIYYRLQYLNSSGVLIAQSAVQSL